jgi:hypothetical protein
MPIRLSGRVVFVLLLLMSLSMPAFARGKKTEATTEPGTYKEWGPDIDQIEIVKKFKFADYNNVVVVPLNTADVDKKDKAVETVIGTATEDFADELKKQVKTNVTVDATPKKSADALIIRTKVVNMEPGSRAKRYLASFGAGAAVVKVEGEIVDAKSNKVLARFTQERRSGFGVAGGSSESLLRRDLRALATDVANILKAF